jgi:plasmid maintenance system antidote protein VapI
MNPHHGSTLDSLFDDLGEQEEVEALAAKKILAIQAGRRMKELGLSTTRLAQRMHTSRNQVLRCLDPGDAGITLKMLFRLARALEAPLRLDLRAAAGAPLNARRGRTKPAPRRRSAGEQRRTAP